MRRHYLPLIPIASVVIYALLLMRLIPEKIIFRLMMRLSFFDGNDIRDRYVAPWIQHNSTLEDATYQGIPIAAISETDGVYQHTAADSAAQQAIHGMLTQTIKPEYVQQVFPDTQIVIAPNGYLFEITSHGDYNCCFLPFFNIILINQFVLEEPDQLRWCIGNEMSHATVSYQRTRALPDRKWQQSKTSDHQLDLLCPWQNTQQATELSNAIDQYEKSIGHYLVLLQLPPSLLSQSHRKKLALFNRAIQTYIPPKWGKDHTTANQVKFMEVNGQVQSVIKLDDVMPNKPGERTAYLQRNFFQEHQNQELIYYRNLSPELAIANKISDFDSLSPKMRKTFGPELCKYLSLFHEVEDHCAVPG